MTKQYVRIQSNITINVTAGLQNEDVSDKDAHIPDRLKVNPMWPKMTCMIMQGAGVYPACIATWNTVKALEKDGILTIGEFTDDGDEKAVDLKQKLDASIAEVEARLEHQKKVRKVSDLKLEDLAGE